jgi:DsbC/DsbD-like thiol-disulfide interchange protein
LWSTAIALLCLAAAAQSSGHLKAGQAPKVAGKRGAAIDAKIPLVVDPGFHVNSNTPSDETLIPLAVTWKSTGALEGGKVTYPKPSLEKYAGLEKPISVFTGPFEVVAHFKVAANAPAGPGVAVGQVKYQACNSNTCFPPKTAEITLPYSVQ